MSESLWRRWRSLSAIVVAITAVGLAHPVYAQDDGESRTRPPFSQLKVSSTSLSFPTVNLNNGPSTPEGSVTLTNIGSEPLSVTVTSPNALFFNVTDGAGSTTLAPNEPLTVQADFAPTMPGSFTGAIAISSGATKGEAQCDRQFEGFRHRCDRANTGGDAQYSSSESDAVIRSRV